MQSHERELLTSNIDRIARAINFADVSQLLLISGIFNKAMMDHIQTYEDDHYRKLVLLADLQTRGPTAFRKFVEILELTGCIEALRIISPASLFKDDCGRTSERYYPNKKSAPSWNPFISSSMDATKSATDSPLSFCLPSDISTCSLGQNSSHSQPANCNTAINFMESSNSIVVKQAIVLHNNTKEHYKFTSRPRGPCLIINNVDFDSATLPRRPQSDQESKMLQDVFHQLGFEVHHERNLTAMATWKTFSKLSSACRAQHDALFVIILSHGSESGIYGTDGIEVDLNDIMSCFDNRRCKTMIGKPKVFIVQSCRGRIRDYTSSEDSTDSAESPPMYHSQFSTEQPVMISRGSEGPGTGSARHAIRTDMLLCFSCVPGYVSEQDKFGPALCKVLAYHLMKSAWEKEFQKILNMVVTDIGRQESNGEGVEISCFGWSKNLYLNPGIYR